MNSISIYRTIFRQMINIVWRHKYLWFFGIFAALVSNAGEINLMLDNFPQVSENSSSLEILRVMYKEGLVGRFIGNTRELLSSLDLWGFLLFALILAVLFFLVWLAVVSQASLFASVYKIFKKQKTDFVDSLKTGRQRFWHVLWLNVIARLATLGVWILIGLPLVWLYMIQGSNIVRVLFVVLAFVILIPLAMVISFLLKYAVLFNVTKKTGPKESIKGAWKLFIKNWLVSLEMAVLIFLSGILVILALALLVGVVSIPLSLAVVLLTSLKLANLAYLTLMLAAIILLVLILWVGAMWSVFRHGAWAILFIRISEGNILAKLLRVFSRQKTAEE